ncbi:LOW QUALITY PROTEIN: hypothetical protein ACHAW6_005072 [Cyclotella cf. meneghiniana]
MQTISAANNHRYPAQRLVCNNIPSNLMNIGLCTISTLLWKYKYLRPPMGLKCSPDIAQSIMESVLANINDADVYIDNVGVFSPNWDYHIKLLSTILRHL